MRLSVFALLVLFFHHGIAVSSSNRLQTRRFSVTETPDKLYLGHGIYLYRSNRTSGNSTRKWQVDGQDIPKLYRLSFPAAGTKITSNTQSGEVMGDNSRSHYTDNGSVEPWILGLASFVGCLLIVVVITVAVLARQWIVRSWRTRSLVAGQGHNDLDNLVIVEADLDSPKYMGNSSNNTAAQAAANRINDVVAPRLVVNDLMNYYDPSGSNDFPTYLNSGLFLPSPILPTANILVPMQQGNERFHHENHMNISTESSLNCNNYNLLQCQTDVQSSSLANDNNVDSNKNPYVPWEQPELNCQSNSRNCYNSKQDVCFVSSEGEEVPEGSSDELAMFALYCRHESELHKTEVGNQPSSVCDINVICCDAASAPTPRRFELSSSDYHHSYNNSLQIV